MHSLAEFAVGMIDADLLSTWGERLLLGAMTTVRLVELSCGIGFVLAYPLSLARASRNPLLAAPALGYITFFRGTPLLCQLYLTYYGAGEVRPFLASLDVWWFFRDSFYCCIFAFALNTAAYQAEIMRGAIAAVPRGQVEAARALGLSRLSIARHVVWPQALLVALRPFGNELISMIKASALSAIVTVLDLMGETRFIFSKTFDFSIYLYCALIYLAATQTIGVLWNRAERFLSRHLAVAPPPEAGQAGRENHPAAMRPARAAT